MTFHLRLMIKVIKFMANFYIAFTNNKTYYLIIINFHSCRAHKLSFCHGTFKGKRITKSPIREILI